MRHYYGDIPLDHLELMNELETLEEWFKENGSTLPAITAAKGHVSMAHDWYSLECDEHGRYLLDRAEELYPGYFESAIYNHLKTDPDFAALISNFRYMHLGNEYLRSLGFKYEQV